MLQNLDELTLRKINKSFVKCLKIYIDEDKTYLSNKNIYIDV